MSDPIVTLSDLITTALNEANLGFVAERAYVPEIESEDLTKDTILVFVVPKAAVDERAGRGDLEQVDRDIDIGVIKRLSTGAFNNDEIDAMLDKVGEVKRLLRKTTFAGFQRIKTQHPQIYNPSHLTVLAQFTSVLTITYRAVERGCV